MKVTIEKRISANVQKRSLLPSPPSRVYLFPPLSTVYGFFSVFSDTLWKGYLLLKRGIKKYFS
jgi:hypothetical protein